MWYCLLLVASIPALAQQVANFGYDAEGRRVSMAAPSQKVEERVVSESPEGKVVERIIRKFDDLGKTTGSEKELVEEKRSANGGKSVRSTLWDGDLNGQWAMRERATTQSSKTGDRVQSETQVERINLSGTLEVADKKVGVRTGDEKRFQVDATVYRKNANGGFEEAEREIKQVSTNDGEVQTSTTQYNRASTGKMEFAGQQVSRLEKRPDGSETEVVDVYGQTSSGRVTDGFSGAAPKLREQQVIERKRGADKSVTETLSIRRPEVDSNRLGALTRISETVCQGPCRP